MRRRLATIGLSVAVLAIVAGCGSSSGGGGGAGGSSTNASGENVVNVGTVSGSSADAAMFIAVDKGYFSDEGIDIKFHEFDSGARMVAPLGAGQLDVASGGISAGLFNAITSGVGLKIVADKSRVIPPGFVALCVAKKLVDSGRFKDSDYADLKGMTVALPAKGTITDPQLGAFLAKAGLTLKDVKIVQLGFADQVPALANGSIDAAICLEPSVSKAVKTGAAVRVAGASKVLPGAQTSAILYGDKFIKDEPDLATRFMIAYIKGVRYYDDALVNGRLTGPHSDEIAKILAKHTAIKDPGFYKKVPLHGVNPNGRSSVKSIENSIAFWKKEGLIDGDPSVKDALDPQFIEAAVKKLGPYKGEIPKDLKEPAP